VTDRLLSESIPERVAGEPDLTRAAARIVEAYKAELPMDSAARIAPPSKLDMERVRHAIMDNGGLWRPVRDMVRMATAMKVKRCETGDDPPGSVRYGLAAWTKEQERKRKEAQKRTERMDHPINPACWSGDTLAKVKEWEEPTPEEQESIRRKIADTLAKLRGVG